MVPSSDAAWAFWIRFWYPALAMAARIPMMAITRSSSMRVKPRCARKVVMSCPPVALFSSLRLRCEPPQGERRGAEEEPEGAGPGPVPVGEREAGRTRGLGRRPRFPVDQLGVGIWLTTALLRGAVPLVRPVLPPVHDDPDAVLHGVRPREVVIELGLAFRDDDEELTHFDSPLRNEASPMRDSNGCARWPEGRNHLRVKVVFHPLSGAAGRYVENFHWKSSFEEELDFEPHRRYVVVGGAKITIPASAGRKMRTGLGGPYSLQGHRG